MTVTLSAPSSPVETASPKRKREEPEAGTYDAFDLAFRDAIRKGINALNYGPIFKELFAEANQIESLDERDEAFSEMADYLRKTLGLENRDVRAVWLQAITGSTQSKTTLYFVPSLLKGVQSIKDPDLANKWLGKAVRWVQENECAREDRIEQLQAIVAEYQKMEPTDPTQTLIKTKTSAERSIRMLQSQCMRRLF